MVSAIMFASGGMRALESARESSVGSLWTKNNDFKAHGMLLNLYVSGRYLFHHSFFSKDHDYFLHHTNMH